MKVSVLIGSYNHGNFIKECIESVLRQTYQDFEIIIVDDGSTDHTWSEIQKFKDARIISESLPKNMGACYAGLKAYEKAKGEYICILSSDDRWKPDKLEKQIKFLESNSEYAAVFSFADYIDDFSRPLFRSENDVFIQKNRSQAEWFRRLFFEGNCLCHPSIMIRRPCYAELGYYDNRFRQLPDFKMWIHFIKKYQFYVLQESLIDFRLHGSGANTSAPSAINSNRTWTELFFLTEEFLSSCPLNLFYESFASELKRPDLKSEDHMKIEMAFVYLGCKSSTYRMYGLRGLIMLFNLMSVPRFTELLLRDYSFSMNDFYKLTGETPAFFNQGSSIIPLGQADDRAVVTEALNRLKKVTASRAIRFLVGRFKKAFMYGKNN